MLKIIYTAIYMLVNNIVDKSSFKKIVTNFKKIYKQKIRFL